MFERELEIAEELMAKLRDPIDRLHRLDVGLAMYLRRSTRQLAVTLHDARWQDQPQQLELVQRAEQAIAEIIGTLELARAWGHFKSDEVASARLLLDAEIELLGRAPQRLAG